MAYGKIKVDTITFDDGGTDSDLAVSGIPSAADINAKADIASPTFTGTPAAPTATAGTSTTQIATTAFVAAAIPDTSNFLENADVGVTVQGYDADTAKTDVAQTFTKPQRGTVTEYTGTQFNINFGATNNHLIKPSGNYTVSLTGLGSTKGQTGSIFIQPTASANITGSFPSTMRFVGGASGISLTGTSGSIDRIDYIVLDDTSSSEVITCNVTTDYIA
jgi:hypothetical protein